MPHKRPAYNVALSYASDDVALARDLYEQLTAAGITVYDPRVNEADPWGKNLSEELPRIHATSSRYALIISSSRYAQRKWLAPSVALAVEAGNRDNDPLKVIVLRDRIDAGQLPRSLNRWQSLNFA